MAIVIANSEIISPIRVRYDLAGLMAVSEYELVKGWKKP